MNDKILDRIKKLFALGSNNSNEYEADSAMKMAKKLLDKHNLSAYDLKEESDVGIKIEDNVNMPWTRMVYGSIARLYDVEYLIDKSCKPTQHLLIGTESNRVTASIVIDFVIKEIRWYGAGEGNAFRNAAAMGIKEQVNKIMAERNSSKEEVVPGSGLVPYDLTKKAISDNNDWISKNIGKIGKSSKSSFKFDQRGKSIGSNINLNPHLSNKIALN